MKAPSFTKAARAPRFKTKASFKAKTKASKGRSRGGKVGSGERYSDTVPF